MDVLLMFFVSSLLYGLNAGEEKCSSLFLRYSPKHTYCLPPKTTCKILKNKVSASDIDIILREHNTYRNQVATGNEKTYSLPKGSNVLQMEWDDDLAAVAQKHSDQCVFEHDCGECRRVQNFDVGQNLYERTVYPDPPKPDWAAAVKSWYDEVHDFEKEQVDSFQDGDGPPPTGHFTQVIWAKSWRLGCGYTMYKDDNKYVELYTCNYGPAGNVRDEKIYEKGNPCDGCPVNSCCGKSCPSPSYPGLCKISGNKAPQYTTGESIFSCTFNYEPDCARKTTSGVDKWKVTETLSGSHIGIVLNEGESSTLNFTTPFNGKSSMCLVSYFRKGPNVAGAESANEAVQIISIPKINYSFNTKMQLDSVDFIKFSVTLNWNMETTLAIKFSVPIGKSPQYLELKDIIVQEGQC